MIGLKEAGEPISDFKTIARILGAIRSCEGRPLDVAAVSPARPFASPMRPGAPRTRGGDPDDIEWRIFAPKGTRGMHLEPISASGNGKGLGWDGAPGQMSFSRELEFVIQRGGAYSIKRIERRRADAGESPNAIIWV